MKKTLMLAGSLALSVAANQASAVWTNSEMGGAEDVYLGLQYSQLSYEHGNVPGEFEPSALMLRVGGDINQYIAVEARAGAGTGSDKHVSLVGGTPTTFQMELDYLYGLYAVGRFPVASFLDIYAVGGYSRGKATVGTVSPAVTDKAAENGVSYGFGVNLKIDEAAAITLEYMSYLNKSNFDATALSIGITNRF